MENGNLDFVSTFDELSKLAESMEELSYSKDEARHLVGVLEEVRAKVLENKKEVTISDLVDGLAKCENATDRDREIFGIALNNIDAFLLDYKPIAEHINQSELDTIKDNLKVLHVLNIHGELKIILDESEDDINTLLA